MGDGGIVFPWGALTKKWVCVYIYMGVGNLFLWFIIYISSPVNFLEKLVFWPWNYFQPHIYFLKIMCLFFFFFSASFPQLFLVATNSHSQHLTLMISKGKYEFEANFPDYYWRLWWGNGEHNSWAVSILFFVGPGTTVLEHVGLGHIGSRRGARICTLLKGCWSAP